LKAFAACGVHGTTAITAITAQNTTGVIAVQPIEPDVIVAQIRAVVADIGVDAVKVGMLADATTIAAVAEGLDLIAQTRADAGLPPAPVVVDPVMVSESGATLLAPEARSALIESILPRATVITPNLAEAIALVGGDATAGDPVALAERLAAMGPDAVIVTGGHTTEGADTLIAADGSLRARIEGPRHPDGAAHGSGCTHSSALAAFLAHGFSLGDAALRARAVASGAIRDGLREIGKGAGPVDALAVRARAAQVHSGEVPELGGGPTLRLL
jgi:hydroxymethylpyrimidine/phosphomethylpyrimidine kinase